MKKILFNVPLMTGKEIDNIRQVFANQKFCGDGNFTKLCNKWLEDNTGARKALLTTSCTHALEMAAILLDIKEGDEVIMPSYTFVSTANAFVLRGAKIVFVDIRPDTMNIDEKKIEAAVTDKTKVIVPVHYGGISCEMDEIMRIAEDHNLYVVEDAAQGLMAEYKGRTLGSIGHIGCFSFHETKNYQCGEGGAILLNDESFLERAEIIREKGTDRSKFFRGEIDKYTWVDTGSSYLMSEITAAFLYAQLESAELVTQKRVKLWERYFVNLKSLEKTGKIRLSFVPDNIKHNAHMFFIKLKNIEERQQLINFLQDNGIQTVFHYIPLHSSKAGLVSGKFCGEDIYTTNDSERILRLPLHEQLKEEDIDIITNSIKEFFHG
ncbi:MAG: dTDP-4-amino-4,6-dideoxygalactose transaminase [bacterium]|nr:dTDP-4-amino-4,6-dideoxygalactose transaminase [bacterium]